MLTGRCETIIICALNIFMRDISSRGFCVLPFFGMDLPSGVRCCLLPPDHDIEQIRKEMLADERPDACSACWKLEDYGLTSDRQLKNAAADYYWDRDIRGIEDDCHNGMFYDNQYKIATNSTCNAACVSCNEKSSSHWAKILGKKPTKKMSIQDLDSAIDYKKAISINFLGGESMLSKENFCVLERLLEANNKDCFIQFTTNGSIRLKNNQINLMRKFHNLNIGVSIDGVGSVFEYMRYPLQWSSIVDNIKIFRTITENVSVISTISNLNVMYLPQLLAWIGENNLKYHYVSVTQPSYFRPAALPVSVKQDIIERFEDVNDMRFFLGDTHTNQDDEDFEKMKAIVSHQDTIKKISIKDHLPEFCKLIGYSNINLERAMRFELTTFT